MLNIEKNLHDIHQKINTAAHSCHRNPANIQLLAVSKKNSAATIKSAYRCGQRHFGENYLQEAMEKIIALADLNLCWHFIGPVQSNKTRVLASNFDWVHSIDRLKVATRLSQQRPHLKPALNICIQVNLEGETGKSGVAPDAVIPLARQITCLPRIQLRGLMAIPARHDTLTQQRKPFAQLRQILAELKLQGIHCDTLSMGMSHDMSAAIAEGATVLRIGTAIFGRRL